MQFMRGLQDVWSVSGRAVLEAFDLSPFRLICDVGGERGAQRAGLGPCEPARQYGGSPTEGRGGSVPFPCTCGDVSSSPSTTCPLWL